mgnify:CR=1 FL=1
MSGRLYRVNNWEQLAEEARYSTQNLAKVCGVSARSLERYFMLARRATPHHWLNELRQRKALGLIGTGLSVKEAAAVLYYKQPSHFSREFKRFHGVSPSRISNLNLQMSQLDIQCRETI